MHHLRLGYDAKRLFCNFTGLGNFSRTLLHDLAQFYPENAYHLYTPKIRRNEQTQPFMEAAPFLPFVPDTSFSALWRSYGIVDQLKKDQVQLYHGLSHELPIGLRRSGVKGVVTVHDVIFKVCPELYSPVQRAIYDLKMRHCCRQADKIIAISAHTKQDVVTRYHVPAENVEVIYQACDPIYYQRQPAAATAAHLQQLGITTPYLLTVGSIEPRKNLKTVLLAYQRLPAEVRIPLVVVGRGKHYKQEMQQLVQQLGLADLVVWLENVTDNTQLQALYQEAEALLYPSLYEGFGLPIAEALLSHTPVIASSTSSLPEAGGPDTLYVDPTSAEQLAWSIEKVLTDQAHAQHMRTAGHAYAHHTFAPATLAAQTMACYQRVLD